MQQRVATGATCLLRQQLAERATRGRAADHGFQRTLTHADAAGTVVNAARAEPPLCDREALALANEQVGGRHTHVLQQYLSPEHARQRQGKPGRQQGTMLHGARTSAWPMGASS